MQRCKKHRYDVSLITEKDLVPITTNERLSECDLFFLYVCTRIYLSAVTSALIERSIDCTYI